MTDADDAVNAAAKAIEQVVIHQADRTPLAGNRYAYELFSANVTMDFARAALTAAFAHTGERMAQAIEDAIEACAQGLASASPKLLRSLEAALAAYRSAPRPAEHSGERMARATFDRVWLMRSMCHVSDCKCADRGGMVDDYDMCRIVSRHVNALIAAYRSTRAPEPMAGAVEGWREQWRENDMVEAAVLSLVGGDVNKFPSKSLSRAGGIDSWREIMRGALKAALAASPPPPDGWREIESAPRDATEVELKVPKNGHPGYYRQIGHWAQDLSGSDQPPFTGWFRETGYGFAEITPKPTHWRPLPSPPGEK